MRTEKEVAEMIEEVFKEKSLTREQYITIIRTLRWVLELDEKIILT